ncbi:MAG: hypothetical protein OXM62_05100 [bacterium]|nr:hypothetical protein [bacterium]MDE0234363.1 hypothetical protein [bacterium]
MKNDVVPLTPAELRARARNAEPGSPEWILYSAAAFDAMVECPLILVGGGAQVVHTQQHRPTDIDMVGRITQRDFEALAAAGYEKQGRHWIYAWKRVDGVDVEVPAAVLMGEDPPEIVDVGGHHLRVISLHDLMMDRLVQATDRTDVTWDEVMELAEATFDRVNWDTVRARCMVKRKEDIGLHILPQVLDEVLAELDTMHERGRDNPGASMDAGF